MTAAGEVYSGQIPALPDTTVVRYYVEATDLDNLSGRNPVGAPNQVYRYTVGFQPPPLYVNEIMASNTTALPDPDRPTEFPDWIELYNAGSQPLSLDGMFLSDDPTEPTKFPIPLGLPPVAAGGYVLFYADSAAQELGGYHTNFSLSNTGEPVGLYTAGGNAVISEYAFAPMTADISVGRYPDGSDNWQQSICDTPGAANTPCQLDQSLYLPLITLTVVE
jgi:hypothetical protein